MKAAAGLEITLGGLQLRFEDERVVAWCGGEFDVHVGSTTLPAGHAACVCSWRRIEIRPASNWLPMLAGDLGRIDVGVVLGSRSTDLRAQFGGFEGRTLRDGDVLPLGTRPGSSTPATGNFLVDARRTIG